METVKKCENLQQLPQGLDKQLVKDVGKSGEDATVWTELIFCAKQNRGSWPKMRQMKYSKQIKVWCDLPSGEEMVQEKSSESKLCDGLSS